MHTLALLRTAHLNVCSRLNQGTCHAPATLRLHKVRTGCQARPPTPCKSCLTACEHAALSSGAHKQSTPWCRACATCERLHPLATRHVAPNAQSAYRTAVRQRGLSHSDTHRARLLSWQMHARQCTHWAPARPAPAPQPVPCADAPALSSHVKPVPQQQPACTPCGAISKMWATCITGSWSVQEDAGQLCAQLPSTKRRGAKRTQKSDRWSLCQSYTLSPSRAAPSRLA